MAIHIPFSQRPSGRHTQPVYIGFESRQRRRQRKPKNWWGFSSVLFFFLSVGILSPITLLMGLLGLRKKPRRSAAFGTVLSLGGLAIMASLFSLAVHEMNQVEHRRERAAQQILVVEQVQECENLLTFAAEEFEDFRDENSGALPDHLDGSALAIKHVDPWENELMYEIKSDSAGLRSAGPDGEFFTSDDLDYDIDGETDYQPLLPVDDDDLDID